MIGPQLFAGRGKIMIGPRIAAGFDREGRLLLVHILLQVSIERGDFDWSTDCCRVRQRGERGRKRGPCSTSWRGWMMI